MRQRHERRGLLDVLLPSRRAERARDEMELDRLAQQSPRAADIAARDAAFAQWRTAVASVREHLRGPDGHWLLDALEGPPAEAEDSGLRHVDGPVPPVEVLTQVLTALGEEVPGHALAELVAADGAPHGLPWAPGHVEVGAVERVRAATAARVRALTVVLQVEEDAAHRAFREELTTALAQLGRKDGGTSSAERALSSVRWWPGRQMDLGATTAPMDPLGLNHTFRHLEAMGSSYPAHVHEAADRLHRLSLGEGLPPVDPAAWILSSLRHLAERTSPGR